MPFAKFVPGVFPLRQSFLPRTGAYQQGILGQIPMDSVKLYKLEHILSNYQGNMDKKKKKRYQKDIYFDKNSDITVYS